MPAAAKQNDGQEQARSPAPRVAVVGGGLAGLTSALRLAGCGFNVTLFEAAEILGGNLSSSRTELHGEDGAAETLYNDVYPHMFCEWYANFWDLFENDLGLSRDETFSPRSGVKLLERGAQSFIHLENATSLSAILANLNSGLASWPDMFLLGFSMIDLAATPFERNMNDELENLDVNGFVYSRGYSTQSVAQLQNYILMIIWSIQSEVTAASSYQDFVKHMIAYPRATPFCYLLKGPLQTRIIDPIEQKLLSRRLADGSPACSIRKGATVTRIVLKEASSPAGVAGRPTIGWAPTHAFRTAIDDGRKPPERDEAFDYVVLATPGGVAASLCLEGETGRRIVDFAPQLSQLQRLRGEAIPVLNLAFKKKLAGLPKEIFALAGAKRDNGDGGAGATAACSDADCDMTVLDISQLWAGENDLGERTVLSVAASNRYALPASGDEHVGFLMVQHLHDYLPIFEPGAHWRDPASDIDWSRTNFRSNSDHRLFLDEVGAWNIRPDASLPDRLPYVFFAGDYCRTDVDMATIEAAVQSGLAAAGALQDQHRKDTGMLMGEAVATSAHVVYSDAHFLAVKLALLPFAYAATALSAHLNPGPRTAGGELPPNAYSPKAYSLLLPLAFTLDWWKTLYWLARRLAPPLLQSASPGDAAAHATAAIVERLGRSALDSLASAVDARAEGIRADARPGERLAAAFGEFAEQAGRTTQAAFTELRQFSAPAEPVRRRARIKT